MKKTLISVVVPIYKVEKYLSVCIDDILRQSYKEIEVILVDDGSPDRCPIICDSYAKKDKRVRVIHKKNGGLSDARNAGIEQSKGELICFIDSDDYIASTYLEDLFNCMQKYDADITLCGFSRITDSGEILETDKLRNKALTQKEYWDSVYSTHSVSYVVAWNKLYKKKLFDQVKYTKGRVNEDEIILHDIIRQCKKIASTDKVDYFYRVRGDSIIGKNKNGAMLEDGFYGIYERLKYFIGCKNWLMSTKTALVLMGQLKNKKLNRKFAKDFAKTAYDIPKKYTSMYFRIKLFVLRWMPCVFSIGNK